VVVRQVRVHDVEAVMTDQALDCFEAAHECGGILVFVDDRMREVDARQLLFELVAADVRVMRVDARLAQRLGFRECRRRRAGPAVGGGEMEHLHARRCYTPPRWPSTQNFWRSSPVPSARWR